MLRPYAVALALSPLAQDALKRAAVAPVVRLQVDGPDRAGQVLQDLPLDLVADGVRFLYCAVRIDDKVHVDVAGRAGLAAAQAVEPPDVVLVGGDDVVDGPQLLIGQGDIHDLGERLPGEAAGMVLPSAPTSTGALPTMASLPGPPPPSRRTAWNTTTPQPMATTVAA